MQIVWSRRSDNLLTMPAPILVPLPRSDFDPSEAAIPWRLLTDAGFEVRFATPDGKPASADPVMVSGRGLGPVKNLLRADANARSAFAQLLEDPAFNQPISFGDMRAGDFSGLHIPGGHASGMKGLLESPKIHQVTADFFAADKPVAAVCHGVVAVCRSLRADGRSVIYGRRTTGLPEFMELAAWRLTRLWMGDYYRTYPVTVQAEVTAALEKPKDFHTGPRSLFRDSPSQIRRGFIVRDGNYLSARWPGDIHRYTQELMEMLRSATVKG